MPGILNVWDSYKKDKLIRLSYWKINHWIKIKNKAPHLLCSAKKVKKRELIWKNQLFPCCLYSVMNIAISALL